MNAVTQRRLRLGAFAVAVSLAAGTVLVGCSSSSSDDQDSAVAPFTWNGGVLSAGASGPDESLGNDNSGQWYVNTSAGNFQGSCTNAEPGLIETSCTLNQPVQPPGSTLTVVSISPAGQVVLNLSDGSTVTLENNCRSYGSNGTQCDK